MLGAWIRSILLCVRPLRAPEGKCGAVQGKMGLSKDADMSPFEAGRKLLSLDSQKLTLNDRIDLVFQDADLVPLLVQVRKYFARFCCQSYHILRSTSERVARSVAYLG